MSNVKQGYRLNIHYLVYDGYMGFDDWDDKYTEEYFESNLLGNELNQAMTNFAKSKYKHFRDIKSITCLGPVKDPNDDVEIVKHAVKRNFVCNNCGTEFNVLQHKCEHRQTGFNEFHYVFNCPECHELCYSYKEALGK